MKHVIVIETADNASIEPELAKEFQQLVISCVECITEHFHGECFIQSRFYQESAVKAVKDMFNLYGEE